MALGELQPSPLVEQATRTLREQITGGAWPVGTKLPAETALAKTLGVGRSTVREALRALAGGGLVQARQGSGVFVIAASPVEDWASRLRRAAIADVYEVRMLVEVEAARLAARRRTPADADALRAALARRRDLAPRPGGPWTTSSGVAFVDADVALHAAVVAAAHNPVLTDLFAEFVPAMRQGLIDLVDLLDVRTMEADHGDEAHTTLVNAVITGAPDTAAQALHDELHRTLSHLRTR
ncbi:FadR/GntR family transcriptional regulator [Nonomuraea sediminis]|uniref:FadR/GntR family transcriptional regulator n=1 Tax=Nonomuraea sediminis TaxID=2835864 RepID=UPI001BDD6771|nr:FCD domain-containing protein [Nonomuraea sediminis]